MAKMTQIQRKRTKRFMEFLGKRSKEQFDINHVCIAKVGVSPTEKGELTCGAAACAVGLMPIFNPKVFEYYQKYDGILYQYYFVRIVGSRVSNEFGYMSPPIEYFGFNYRQAWYCFSSNAYDLTKTPTPKMVAKRIQEVLDGKFAEEED